MGTPSRGARDVVAIPGQERAVLDAAKIRCYLLSTTHPIGRAKARFFQGLGYVPERWYVLANDLRRHAATARTARVRRSPHGRKHELRGTLVGPTGRHADLVSVWIFRNGEDFPRFVTAFPA